MRRAILNLIALAVALVRLTSPGALSAASPGPSGPLSLDERVAYQRAIEEVFWRHRLWPQENPTPKPPIEAVLSSEQVRAQVADSLRLSSALEGLWGQPITGAQLQAEVERQAVGTQQPEVLRELWQVLGNDPHLIAELLARPALAERLARSWYEGNQTAGSGLRSAVGGLSFEAWWQEVSSTFGPEIVEPQFAYTLPEFSTQAATVGSWTPTFALPEADLETTAVWTGALTAYNGDNGSFIGTLTDLGGGNYAGVFDQPYDISLVDVVSSSGGMATRVATEGGC